MVLEGLVLPWGRAGGGGLATGGPRHRGEPAPSRAGAQPCLAAGQTLGGAVPGHCPPAARPGTRGREGQRAVGHPLRRVAAQPSAWPRKPLCLPAPSSRSWQLPVPGAAGGGCPCPVSDGWLLIPTAAVPWGWDPVAGCPSACPPRGQLAPHRLFSSLARNNCVSPV